MSDEMANLKPSQHECGVINLQPHTKTGTHWICWFIHGTERIFFDSYAGLPPIGLTKYLKTGKELTQNLPVIKRSTITVQHDATVECGGLCLFVLYYLCNNIQFPKILIWLQQRYQQKSPCKLIINHPPELPKIDKVSSSNKTTRQ